MRLFGILALLVTVTVTVTVTVALAAAQQPQPILPDPKLTPGDAFEVSAQDVCTPGYSKRVRNVPQSVKEAVYRENGITAHPPNAFEVDHLVPLELGGSNSIKNLWPESYLTSRPYRSSRLPSGVFALL